MFYTNVRKPDDLHPGDWYSATDVLNELNLHTSLNFSAYGVQKIGYLVRKYGFKKKRFHDGWRWCVYIIPIEQENSDR